MVKLKDIAKETGLTMSTISKALNHSSEISEETTNLVLETAARMGYVPRKKLKDMEKNIGIILPEVKSHYYASLMEILSHEGEKHGCNMVTMLTSGYPVDLKPALERISKYKPDGLIVGCGGLPFDMKFHGMRGKRIPVVALREKEQLNSPIDGICISGYYGVGQAVDHLHELGHIRIGYLGEHNSGRRYQAFCEAMKRNGLRVEPRFVRQIGTRFEAGGYEAACELLKEKELPTAIFACYDQFAFGAMKAFMEQGLRIPEDISVVGYDNVEMSEYYPVPLTSVTNPVEQMGITAVNILLAAMEEGEKHVVQNVFLQTRLVVRKSTCPPGQRG